MRSCLSTLFIRSGLMEYCTSIRKSNVQTVSHALASDKCKFKAKTRNSCQIINTLLKICHVALSILKCSKVCPFKYPGLWGQIIDNLNLDYHIELTSHNYSFKIWLRGMLLATTNCSVYSNLCKPLIYYFQKFWRVLQVPSLHFQIESSDEYYTLKFSMGSDRLPIQFGIEGPQLRNPSELLRGPVTQSYKFEYTDHVVVASMSRRIEMLNGYCWAIDSISKSQGHGRKTCQNF